MAVEIKIVIPSAGRPKMITSHRYVSNSIICVSEREQAEYQKYNPRETIVTHPDDVLGIASKRQWIYNKYPNVFMLDDDLHGISKLYMKKKEHSFLTSGQAYDIIQATGNIAKLIGCYLFGFNNHVRPEHYHGNLPYKLTGYINGAGLGMLEGATKLSFNPAIKTNNDFYIAGLNAYYYRKCFIDKRFCMSQDSFANNIGGCANMRTNETEKEDFALLKRFFGSAIQLKSKGLQAAKHKFSKTLEIPF